MSEPVVRTPMKVGDERYNKHFHNMIMGSLVCGLGHPVEWLTDYGRMICMPYDQIPEMDEFVSLAWYELFEAVHCRRAENENDIQKWINEYYNQPKG